MALGGSKMLDKRRRRLVLETEVDSSATAPEPTKEIDSTKVGLADLSLSLTQVVPQRLWMCWAIGAIGAFLSGVFLSAWLLAENASSHGSALSDMISLFADRLLRAGGAVAWLLAGQLSCAVWWARSRSRLDYGGRFHVWGWTAAGFFLAAMMCLTDSHRFVAQVVAWEFTGATERSTGVTAIWLLPIFVGGLTLWATLATEFRDSLHSRVLHSLAAVMAFLLVIAEFSVGRIGTETEREFLGKLLLVAMQWCHLMSVWLHLRHVVHVSADPPVAGTSGWLVAWKYGPGRVVSAFARRTLKSSEETLEGTASAESQKRVQLEHADGTSQDLRIDDAESAVKGPNKRARQAARK